ncbi:hypothetical protein [uncultured Sphingomonas sp.]|uniref:hypothetical protein n=1 Tax=uncultured Sphingomonas sp. TaxID=158754 RepID=UPI003749D2B5
MSETVVHIRNGRSDHHRPHVRGNGVTWCGKKLVGEPAFRNEQDARSDIQTFNCYGSDVAVALDPALASCPHCRQRFDAAYNAAFPEGAKPIATFKLDNPDDMARARAALSPEALNRFFALGGEGMSAFERALTGKDHP